MNKLKVFRTIFFAAVLMDIFYVSYIVYLSLTNDGSETKTLIINGICTTVLACVAICTLAYLAGQRMKEEALSASSGEVNPSKQGA